MNSNPLVVEVIGPAGAGKTTLIKLLLKANKNSFLVTKPSFRSARKAPYIIYNMLSLLPIFLREPINSMRLSSRQLYWLLYLNGWYTNLDQQIPNDCSLNIIDHGPIYMLTSLLGFGPEITQSNRFQKWWEKILEHWVSFLDIVIWLEAPNSILTRRINARNSWHIIKEKPEQTIHNFLNQYRTSFEHVMSISKTLNDSLKVLRFNTGQETPEQIVNKILNVNKLRFTGPTCMAVNK